ncbi:MAG: nicotinamide riboside transporter PnuC [Bacteroidales bacterium]|jgi:nicotinamide mononucleotide transporter|nr:nicotinamide riboside transporter PnuC [Bacteroidales bacterium]
MNITEWLSINWLEVFGAITGIIYVFLEIRQNIWLWPVGLVTSAVYIIVFFTTKFYADMSLQGYYLVMSIMGWYWWVRGTGHVAQGGELRAQGAGNKTGGPRDEETEGLQVTRLKPVTGLLLTAVFILLYSGVWFILSRFTDSPVPEWDSFITSLSVVATWMLARKIYEHWYLWILVNAASVVIFVARGLYPTVILYAVYLAMSFLGLKIWKKSLPESVTGKN